MKKLCIILGIAAMGVFLVSQSLANVDQLKTYRKVYKDYKPKCTYCHMDEKPKKDENEHELNTYGLKLQELMAGEALTEEMIKIVGNHEDFTGGEEPMTDKTREESKDETGSSTTDKGAGSE